MDGNTDSNAFLTSLQQYGQWLAQQNQGTGSGQPIGGGQPSKVIHQTQVHYAQPTVGDTSPQPAVSAAPAQPQAASFTPPQGGTPAAAPQPNAVTVGDYAAGAPQAGAGQTEDLGRLGGPGSGQPTSNAISGITSALSKGLTNAANTIGGVKTMPTPVQSGPFPGINQATPTLIGRRTQQPTAY